MSRKADQDRRLILNLQQGDRLAVGLRSCARVMIIGPLATIIIVGLIALFEPDVRGPWATLTVITVLFSIIFWIPIGILYALAWIFRRIIRVRPPSLHHPEAMTNQPVSNRLGDW